MLFGIGILVCLHQKPAILKTTLLAFLISAFGFVAQAQSLQLKVSSVTDQKTIGLLSSIEQFETFEGTKLYLKIFVQGNPPGSAKMPEGHEISHNLMLVVGEYELYFDGKLYEVGEFYRPKIKAKYESQGKIKLKVEHGLAANRKEAEITVDLDKVTLK
jgi:hypothetical protein